MNATELAMALLKWQQVELEQRKLEQDISAEIMKLGKSQNVGLVEAKYYAGKRKLDWETPGKTAPADIIESHTTHSTSSTINYKDAFNVATEMLSDEDKQDLIDEFTTTQTSTNIDWKKICEKAKIEEHVLDPGTPKVTLILKEE